MHGNSERRSPASRKYYWLAIGLLLVVVGLAVGAYFGAKGILKAVGFSNPNLPPAAVHVGTQLPWRTLGSGNALNPLIGFSVPGDFDGDGKDELLFCNSIGSSRLYEMDGGSKLVGIDYEKLVNRAGGWDSNGDGRDELITDNKLSDYLGWREPVPPEYSNINPSLVTPVIDINGRIIDNLLGWDPGINTVIGDFDGDGLDDLMLRDSAVGPHQAKYIFYSPNGKLGSMLDDNGAYYYLTGDFDGDGSDEVAKLGAQGGVLIFSYEGEPFVAPHDPVMGLSWAADLNGDGIDELLSNNQGYIDLTTGKLEPWQFPANSHPPSEKGARVVTGDFDADGSVDIAIMGWPDRFGTSLYLFKPDGSCTYYEEFGKEIEGMYVVTAGGQDYLVLHFVDRIIAWP